MTKRWIAFAIIGLNAVLAVQPATARGKSVEVHYSDLNLTSERGREVLNKRLSGAVRQICGIAKAPGVGEAQDVRGCRTATLAQAMTSRDKLLARLDSGEPLLIARADPSRRSRH
jgi:UrcA family protein